MFHICDIYVISIIVKSGKEGLPYHFKYDNVVEGKYRLFYRIPW